MPEIKIEKDLLAITSIIEKIVSSNSEKILDEILGKLVKSNMASDIKIRSITCRNLAKNLVAPPSLTNSDLRELVKAIRNAGANGTEALSEPARRGLTIFMHQQDKYSRALFFHSIFTILEINCLSTLSNEQSRCLVNLKSSVIENFMNEFIKCFHDGLKEAKIILG